MTNCPLTRVPLAWVWIHIAPLLSLAIPWHSVTDVVSIAVAIGFAVFAIVAGLLINWWWTRFLIIIGMSIWFSWGMCVLGGGV
jgi:hypothetical protein